MRGEAPRFKRCCFCIPLRRGLIGWGYAKLVINILSIAYIILISCLVARRYITVRDIIILSVICVFLLTDSVFNIIFIVAGHRKSVKLLHISYIYSIVSLVLVILAHSFKIYLNLRYIYFMWQYLGFRWYHHVLDFTVGSGLAFCIIFVQIYFILLIRSEMIKLRHQRLEMQFSNHLASGEPQCTLHILASVVQDSTGKDVQAVQDCTGKDVQTVQDCTGKDAQAAQDCTGGRTVTNFVTN